MQITLYQFETCPYCAKVRGKLNELGLDYDKVNVANDREDAKRQEIAKKRGVLSVPVIEIDGKWIGDSARIIEYLESM